MDVAYFKWGEHSGSTKVSLDQSIANFEASEGSFDLIIGSDVIFLEPTLKPFA